MPDNGDLRWEGICSKENLAYSIRVDIQEIDKDDIEIEILVGENPAPFVKVRLDRNLAKGLCRFLQFGLADE